jgi:hypothetical protein
MTAALLLGSQSSKGDIIYHIFATLDIVFQAVESSPQGIVSQVELFARFLRLARFRNGRSSAKCTYEGVSGEEVLFERSYTQGQSKVLKCDRVHSQASLLTWSCARHQR